MSDTDYQVCPACGSEQVDVCQLLGHTYPIKERAPLNPLAQPCATCKWAAFQTTNHRPPRINVKQYGQCSWPVPERVAVARCITSISTHNAHRSVIWAKDTGCPVWTPKE